jgi:hypothetical protein
VRGLEHVYLINDEAIAMAEQAGTLRRPDHASREDLQAPHRGTCPSRWWASFRRDHEQIQAAQRRVAASVVKIAYGECSMAHSPTLSLSSLKHDAEASRRG